MPKNQRKPSSVHLLQLVIASAFLIAPPDVSPSQSGLALLFVREHSFEAEVHALENEELISNCINDTLTATRPELQIVGLEELQDHVFPELPLAAVPRHPRYMDILLRTERIRSRIEGLNVRYIAYVGGVSETEQDGSGFCAGGYGGAGCFVFLQWHEKARLGATVVDLSDPALKPESIQADSEDTAWLAIIGVIPLGAPSNAEDFLCRDVGQQISEYLDEKEKTD